MINGNHFSGILIYILIKEICKSSVVEIRENIIQITIIWQKNEGETLTFLRLAQNLTRLYNSTIVKRDCLHLRQLTPVLLFQSIYLLRLFFLKLAPALIRLANIGISTLPILAFEFDDEYSHSIIFEIHSWCLGSLIVFIEVKYLINSSYSGALFNHVYLAGLRIIL